MFKAVLKYMDQRYRDRQIEFSGNNELEAYVKALNFMESSKGPSPDCLRRMTGLKLHKVEGDVVKGIN